MVKDRGDLFNSQIDVSLFQGKNLTWQISGVGAMVIHIYNLFLGLILHG